MRQSFWPRHTLRHIMAAMVIVGGLSSVGHFAVQGEHWAMAILAAVAFLVLFHVLGVAAFFAGLAFGELGQVLGLGGKSPFAKATSGPAIATPEEIADRPPEGAGKTSPPGPPSGETLASVELVEPAEDEQIAPQTPEGDRQ